MGKLNRSKENRIKDKHKPLIELPEEVLLQKNRTETEEIENI